MVNKHTYRRFALTFVTFVVVAMFATAATADTIYMKNGRVIRSSQVRVEGDRVFFTQFGGEASVPMDLVDRIVEDESLEPTPTTTAPPALPTATGEATGSDESADETAEDVPDEQTREFWQDRVRSIEAEKTQVQLQIEDLRRTERAFLFSHRSTAETRQSIEEAQTRLTELDKEFSDLSSEARRAGVPAGWLRLPPGEAGGGAGPGGSGGPGGDDSGV